MVPSSNTRQNQQNRLSSLVPIDRSRGNLVSNNVIQSRPIEYSLDPYRRHYVIGIAVALG
jgi:hypothetical protein